MLISDIVIAIVGVVCAFAALWLNRGKIEEWRNNL